MLKILAYIMKVHRDVLERFSQRHFGVFSFDWNEEL